MKHKVKRIHFIASERAQSRSLLLSLAIAACGRAANTDEASHEA